MHFLFEVDPKKVKEIEKKTIVFKKCCLLNSDWTYKKKDSLNMMQKNKYLDIRLFIFLKHKLFKAKKPLKI